VIQDAGEASNHGAFLAERSAVAADPLLPKVHTGPVRVDDRRVISGILFVLREGCRWRALPDAYGPRTTVYNRFNRWSKRGLWQKLLAELVEAGAAPDLAMIDSSAVEGGWAFIAAAAYTALAVSVFGHTVYFVLIRKYEANLIAALTLICPLMAIGLGVIITGDQFDVRMAVGTVVVLAGVLLIFLAPQYARSGLT
jgi:transposase